MSINPLTYADLENNTEVHAIGEIWTSAIWDMYWNLVDKYGRHLGHNQFKIYLLKNTSLLSCF